MANTTFQPPLILRRKYWRSSRLIHYYHVGWQILHQQSNTKGTQPFPSKTLVCFQLVRPKSQTTLTILGHIPLRPAAMLYSYAAHTKSNSSFILIECGHFRLEVEFVKHRLKRRKSRSAECYAKGFYGIFCKPWCWGD